MSEWVEEQLIENITVWSMGMTLMGRVPSHKKNKSIMTCDSK